MQTSETTYEQLREMLTSGALQPGDKLITRNLAESLGVSLGPIREAIQRLASEGLVKHTPGAGAVVRKPTRQELEELYVLRDATESCAAGLVAKHASDYTLQQFETLIEQWEALSQTISQSKKQTATPKQFEQWLDLEEQFHELLIEASRNSLLAKVIRDHRAIERVFGAQRHHAAILTAEVAANTCRGKRELVQALRDGDSELARQLMSQQIQIGQAHVLRHFSS